MRWNYFLSAKEVSTYFKNTYETTQPVFSHGVDSDGKKKVYTTEIKEFNNLDDLRDWVANSNPCKTDKLFIYQVPQIIHPFDTEAIIVPCIRYAWVREEKPTIETLINLIENSKELQGTKDKLIESAKEFFEPLKKLYVTKRYFYPSNNLCDNSWIIKQEVVEEPLYIEYRYSTDCKIIVLIKFNIGKTAYDMTGIFTNTLSQTDFDFPLESDSLKNVARLIKERGEDYKVKEETKAFSEAAKHIVKEDIKSIIYSFYFQANDEITHSKIRAAISKNLIDRFGVDYNFNVHSFKMNDSWLGGLEFKISSKLFNWTVSLTENGIIFEEKRGL